MAQPNGLLQELMQFFGENGFDRKVDEKYIIGGLEFLGDESVPPRSGIKDLQIDYYPGRQGGFNRYARMGRPLRDMNVLVLKNVNMLERGGNMTMPAVVELLSNPDIPIDAVVFEDIQNPALMQRMIDGENGRRRWLPSPLVGQPNVYLTRDQVQAEFTGGTRRRKKRRKSRKVRARKL